MMRVAIYARFSSDLQNERSIDDQVRLCRQLVDSKGWEVAEIYADYAISGSHLRSRPNAVRLLDDAKAGRFDIVVAEALDRLSRDQEDTAAIHKRLNFAGVKIVTISEGEVSEMHVGLASTMSAMFLKGLATKIRRGQEGLALKGFAPGGLGYGYKVKREFDAKGELIRGLREIDQEQAAVIRRIFAEAGTGRSARAIAGDLNRDGIAAPFGGIWRASAINGNRARGTGVLWNQAYIGLLVYNRVTMVKDPDTGKRISRVNPTDKWVVTEVPAWRIVDDEAWDAVQGIKKATAGMAVHKTRRPKHLLSGLIFCACCGGAYTIKSKDQLSCVNHREAGACDNGRTIRIADIQRRVLGAIQEKLLDPDRITQAIKEYRIERKRDAAGRAKRQSELMKRIEAADREISNLVEAIAQAGLIPVFSDRLKKAQKDKALAEAELNAQSSDDNVVELHPAAINAYRQAVSDLETILAGDAQARQEAMQVIRPLIQRIEVNPEEKKGATSLKLYGALPKMLGLGNRRPGQPVRTVMMVAGEGVVQHSPTIVIAC